MSAPSSTQEPVKPDDNGVKVTELQKMLAEYGYGIDVTGRYDVATTEVVTAFQRHFRPAQVDGIADAATLQTLRKLLIARDSQPQKPRRAMPSRPQPKDHRLPLDGGRRRTPSLARQSAGRPLRQSPKGGRGGKSGLHGQTVPDNVRRGQPQGQCHREQTAAARCVLPRQG